MNKFEEYTARRNYKQKLDMLEACFVTFGEITVRDMLFAPFWYNCPYSAMRNLKKLRGINFTKEPLIKDGKKVCEVYKLA